MKHLTLVQRYQIEAYIEIGWSDKEIGGFIGCDRSTIWREIKRNSLTRESYDAEKADKLYKTSKRRAGEAKKKMKGDLEKEVCELIKEDYSPEQISGRLLSEGKQSVSHPVIYNYIWEDKSEGGQLYKHLRNSGKKKKKGYGKVANRGKIKNKRSIEERPEIVENKGRIGDWEGDTIIGKNHKGAIVTLTERVSNYELMIKVKSKKSEEVKRAIVKKMRQTKIPIHSITFDNGTEFWGHESIAKLLETEVYFAHPYSSWERGLNEYQNKLIRQYIPKKTDFREVSHYRVKKIEKKLNTRPRKGLNYLTPEEFLEKELGIELGTCPKSG